ncbi:MAG: HAMP domain-containing protein [Deltaproteobacteria bacterium]|nr:HAMP domain-containing protein [Deltaproteobacteria bacterium]
MKMKLRNKLMFGASAMLVVAMFLSAVVVSVIVNSQNREASNSLLSNSSKIIREAISERQYKLLCDTRQMASENRMVGRMKFLVENRASFDFMMVKPTYHEMTEAIYNIALTAHVSKAFIYDNSGRPVSFIAINNDWSYLGYAHRFPSTVYEAAYMNPGDKLTYESWKPEIFLADIESEFDGIIPEQEAIRFEIINGMLCLAAYVPIIGVSYNRETDSVDPRQFGFVRTIQSIDDGFINRMSRLTGTRINIFTRDGLVTGNLKKYSTFDMDAFEEAKWEWDINKQEILLNDVTVEGNGFYQGVLPVYSDAKCLAAIVSLYSKDIVRANTLQMIKLMSIVFVACILFVLPFTVAFSNSMARPITRVVAGLREMAQGKWDASIQVDVKSNDEIGELAKKFNVFATTIKKAQDQLRQLSNSIITSQEKERRAIARELHDELGQIFTALRMDAVWIKEHLKKKGQGAADRASTMCTLIDKSIDNVQGMALRLRPQLLDDLGLIPALEWYIRDFEKRTGIACSLEDADVPELDENQTTAVFRIIQESLTNVARHAHADVAKVSLLGRDNILTFAVEDNGQGFDARRISDSDCQGIAGMRERAALVGGVLGIQSSQGKGTTVSCRIPVNVQNEELN